MSEEFDIDAGVDEIAADMGWESTDESTDFIEENEEVTDEVQETETAEEVTEETQEVQAKAPPASWAKDKHEIWANLPPEAQDYYEQREKQMLDGLEQYKQGYQFASEIQRTIEPFQGMLEQFGVNPTEAIGNLFQWNQALQNGTLEQRQQAFIALGNNLGIIPQEGQPQIDPRTQELQARVARMEAQERQREQQAYQQNYQKVESEVAVFAADPKNEHFDTVADDVIAILKTGATLQDAYEKAVWANPVTRAIEQQKLVDARLKETMKKSTTAAQQAKRATSANVRPMQSAKAASDPVGSWEDTMAETLASLKAG